MRKGVAGMGDESDEESLTGEKTDYNDEDRELELEIQRMKISLEDEHKIEKMEQNMNIGHFDLENNKPLFDFIKKKKKYDKFVKLLSKPYEYPSQEEVSNSKIQFY